ncbi:hypothetical protein ACL7TT_15460 [Microbulbifer sp. 2304DJ12-6]|uniref:hypothetical protein n=1 Tax=Microbulbifer sp. 2304DJ12-6 TaxID=3233340 RepID=UPI0039B04AEE
MKPLPRRLLGGYGLAITAGLSLSACSGTGAPCATGYPDSYYSCNTYYHSHNRHAYPNGACRNTQNRGDNTHRRGPPRARYRGYPLALPDPPLRARPY